MTSRSFHHPYAHQTRFKVVHSTTRLVQASKAKTTPFTLVRKSERTATAVVKSIGNKYKWIRTSLKRTDSNRSSSCAVIGSSFKLDRRKPLASTVANGRVIKRKPRASLSKCLVRIRGVQFHTHPNGKCLQRLASDPDSSKALATKKVEHPIRTRANILLQRSIQISNGRYRLRNSKRKSLTLKKKKNCIYFNRFGKCHRGEKCPFIHDRSRIAVCTQFLNGRCKNNACPYSHELTPGKVPTCSYFIKGACGQDRCPYAHTYVGHDAQICDDFVQGFCSKGNECTKQHVLLCPQFEAKGQCPRGKQCHLTHRRKRDVKDLNKKTSIKPAETLSILPASVMPAYIPLSQETAKKPAQVEFKLKPSFLS